jgi:hypothetical protein
MKSFFCVTVVLFVLSGCQTLKVMDSKRIDFSGIYKQNGSSEKLELKSDWTYILYKAPVTFTPVIEQCEYASKGKWSVVADNVLEITSENYYMQQRGFEYELKQENKFSQDSLYIQVNFPTDFHPIKLQFDFNYNNSKSVITNETSIILAKSKHLWNRQTDTNHIKFSLNADVSGVTLYKSRVLFEIFDEYIDTEKYNHLTITLPYFDRCFFEFEPYKQELIYVKGRNQLFWKGEIWER